mmetsp:Transcript_21258/g.31926  ORF Transcript_21258/g.31926 Transcript_21258/m.31926 type:complete len:149 (+) Transcript_21258:96-542(+)
MRYSTGALLLIVSVCSSLSSKKAGAFIVVVNPTPSTPLTYNQNFNTHIHATSRIGGRSRIRSRSTCSTTLASSVDTEDCGCETIYSGKPSDAARNDINHRSAIAKLPLYRIDDDGSKTTMDEIIGDSMDTDNDNDKRTSIVVFLRSLG